MSAAICQTWTSSLPTITGKPVTSQSFLGQTTLVYFGYTHCPDVCPETMARLMQVMQQLGPDAKNTRIVFITVDPARARDTAAALHDYVRAFDAQYAVGLTGTDGASRALQIANVRPTRWRNAILPARTT